MKIRTGIDLVEIERLAATLEKTYSERFVARVYTPAEFELCAGNIPSLAARFAAKEAVAKALGCGIGKIAWTDVEILRGEAGQPLLILHGKAEKLSNALGIKEWSISLSHSHEHAIAMVVAAG